MITKFTYLIIILFLLISCSVDIEQAFKKENFNPIINYEPLSLHYNSSPLLSIGGSILSIDSNIKYQKNSNENNQFFIKGIENTGAVEAYYGNSKKLETSATGATVTGTLNATTDVTINGKGAATTGKAIAMAMVFG